MSRAAAALGTLAAAAGLAAAAACASPGTPPGGPERRTPPRLVRVSPDSGAADVRPREVVFEYDAVISETPRGGAASASAGTTGLEGLVTVSPRSGSVAVDWRRDRLAVRPRRGFRQNLTYTVTVLPGVQDLRNNVRDSASVVVFSTGGPIARAALRGVVFDWVNGRAAARAVVEATGADSVTYFTVADSAGRWSLRHVPAGSYLVRGTVDVNVNALADPREPFDTARAPATVAPAGPAPAPPPRAPAPAGPPRAPTPPAAALPDTALGLALYAFARDSLPPRLVNVAAADSATLRLTFDRPLRPEQAFAGRVRVAGPDSAAVAVRAVLTPAAADSVAQAEARAAAPRDTTARDSAGPGALQSPFARDAAPPAAARNTPRLGRPAPSTDLVVRLGAALRPNTLYRVRAADLRSLNNVVGTSERTFTTPRAAAAERR